MESSRETEVTVTTLFLLAAPLAVVLAYCAASTIIMRAGRSTPPEDLEYLIVLGAMVRPDGLPTRALRYRLEAALSYLPNTPPPSLSYPVARAPTNPLAKRLRWHAGSQTAASAASASFRRAPRPPQPKTSRYPLNSCPDSESGA